MASSPDESRPRTAICIAAAHETLRRYAGRAPLTSLAPPVPVEGLARMLGFRVIGLTGIPDDFSALVVIRLHLIGINAAHHAHRQRFSLGHELAHVILRHPPEYRSTPGEIRLFDREADLCGSELLMPSFMVCRALEAGAPPAGLAALFGVSPEAMLHRLERLNCSSVLLR